MQEPLEPSAPTAADAPADARLVLALNELERLGSVIAVVQDDGDGGIRTSSGGSSCCSSNTAAAEAQQRVLVEVVSKALIILRLIPACARCDPSLVTWASSVVSRVMMCGVQSAAKTLQQRPAAEESLDGGSYSQLQLWKARCCEFVVVLLCDVLPQVGVSLADLVMSARATCRYLGTSLCEFTLLVPMRDAPPAIGDSIVGNSALLKGNSCAVSSCDSDSATVAHPERLWSQWCTTVLESWRHTIASSVVVEDTTDEDTAAGCIAAQGDCSDARRCDPNADVRLAVALLDMLKRFLLSLMDDGEVRPCGPSDVLGCPLARLHPNGRIALEALIACVESVAPCFSRCPPALTVESPRVGTAACTPNRSSFLVLPGLVADSLVSTYRECALRSGARQHPSMGASSSSHAPSNSTHLLATPDVPPSVAPEGLDIPSALRPHEAEAILCRHYESFTSQKIVIVNQLRAIEQHNAVVAERICRSAVRREILARLLPLVQTAATDRSGLGSGESTSNEESHFTDAWTSMDSIRSSIQLTLDELLGVSHVAEPITSSPFLSDPFTALLSVVERAYARNGAEFCRSTESTVTTTTVEHSRTDSMTPSSFEVAQVVEGGVLTGCESPLTLSRRPDGGDKGHKRTASSALEFLGRDDELAAQEREVDEQYRSSARLLGTTPTMKRGQ